MNSQGLVGLALLVAVVVPSGATAGPTGVYVEIDALGTHTNATVDGSGVVYDGDCLVVDATTTPPEIEIREDCPQS